MGRAWRVNCCATSAVQSSSSHFVTSDPAGDPGSLPDRTSGVETGSRQQIEPQRSQGRRDAEESLFPPPFRGSAAPASRRLKSFHLFHCPKPLSPHLLQLQNRN